MAEIVICDEVVELTGNRYDELFKFLRQPDTQLRLRFLSSPNGLMCEWGKPGKEENETVN